MFSVTYDRKNSRLPSTVLPRHRSFRRVRKSRSSAFRVYRGHAPDRNTTCVVVREAHINAAITAENDDNIHLSSDRWLAAGTWNVNPNRPAEEIYLIIAWEAAMGHSRKDGTLIHDHDNTY